MLTLYQDKSFIGSATAPLPLLSHNKGTTPENRTVDLCVFSRQFRYILVYFGKFLHFSVSFRTFLGRCFASRSAAVLSI